MIKKQVRKWIKRYQDATKKKNQMWPICGWSRALADCSISESTRAMLTTILIFQKENLKKCQILQNSCITFQKYILKISTKNGSIVMSQLVITAPAPADQPRRRERQCPHPWRAHQPHCRTVFQHALQFESRGDHSYFQCFALNRFLNCHLVLLHEEYSLRYLLPFSYRYLLVRHE